MELPTVAAIISLTVEALKLATTLALALEWLRPHPLSSAHPKGKPLGPSVLSDAGSHLRPNTNTGSPWTWEEKPLDFGFLLTRHEPPLYLWTCSRNYFSGLRFFEKFIESFGLGVDPPPISKNPKSSCFSSLVASLRYIFTASGCSYQYYMFYPTKYFFIPQFV